MNCGVMRQVKRVAVAIRTALAGGAVLLGFHLDAGSGAYGEGFTAPAPGTDSEIYWRAFSLGNHPEICAASTVPAQFRAKSVTLRIGQRLQRSERSGVVIEAYNAGGDFVAHVPIIVSMLDPQNIATAGFWDDGDYLKANREGEAELLVTWACASNDRPPVELRVSIVVVAE